mmetsp:Transcript_28204/g.59016  ORF Transcript_28204/g.59016 Transcript_28204/m.59016 type:complete len:83 (+) Transcript_28204:457-705(+)
MHQRRGESLHGIISQSRFIRGLVHALRILAVSNACAQLSTIGSQLKFDFVPSGESSVHAFAVRVFDENESRSRLFAWQLYLL